MTRVLLFGFVLLATACGNKTFPSLCANQAPPPAGCNSPCDPAPGATNACTLGYHCSPDGKCDTQCTAGGGQCGDGYACTDDGHCIPDGSGSGTGSDPDACPSVHVTATKTTPTVELLLDQSFSMRVAYGSSPSRWAAMVKALVDPTNGIVKTTANSVVYGVTLFTGVSGTCPQLTTRPRTLNNYAAISGLLNSSSWVSNTPTKESIDAVVADFAARPPMQGSPPIIVLATDGLPDTCTVPNPNDNEQVIANAETVAAAQRAFRADIKLFYLFVGNDQAGTHPQQMANAGAGLDPATGNAKFYVATDPTQLAQAFTDIIGGVLSCDLALNGHVDPDQAQGGAVLLNGAPLVYLTDWRLDPNGMMIHLLGTACTTLKNAMNPTVDATFSCGAVIF